MVEMLEYQRGDQRDEKEHISFSLFFSLDMCDLVKEGTEKETKQ